MGGRREEGEVVGGREGGRAGLGGGREAVVRETGRQLSISIGCPFYRMSRQLDIHLFLRSECEHNLTWSRDRGIHFIVRLADSGHLGAVWCLVSGIWVWCLVSGVRYPSLAGAMVWAGDGWSGAVYLSGLAGGL